MLKLAILGLGYVGLTTGLGFTKIGHKVTGYDVDHGKLARLKSGQLTIYEDGLQDILSKGLSDGSLTFTEDIGLAVSSADFIFVCVPTPQDVDGAADLSFVLASVESIRGLVSPGAIIVLKSTVPAGSAARVTRVLARTDVNIVSNPEFLREGSALQDFLYPDRIVIGAENPEAANQVASLCSSLDTQVLITSPESAELIKYATNTFLAIKLSFVNDLAALSEAVGADIRQVTDGLGLDKRIGNRFLAVGPGWGGSCFPKDTRALLRLSEQNGLPMPLIGASLLSNQKTQGRVADIVLELVGGSLEGKVIAVWGLAFKANTDDTRESPSLYVIERLLSRGAKVKVYDPVAKAPEGLTVQVCEDPIQTAKGAHCLVILTEWEEFKFLDPEEVMQGMSEKNILDTRSILPSMQWREHASLFRRLGVKG